MHLSSVVLFFGLAAASALNHHGAQHFHPRRQYNASSIAAGQLTTLTVYATEVHTITSCAASVTDCPAGHSEATQQMVVTDVVAVTTTVCPIAQASSASSAAIASYSATATSTNGGVATPIPTFPLSSVFFSTYSMNLPPTTSASSAAIASSPSANSPVLETVLTYVLGSGKSTTVVTTTIRHTQTATVYATLPNGYAGNAGPVAPGAQQTHPAQAPPAGNAPPVKGAATSTAEGVSNPEPTTTMTGTSTSTKYVTVYPVASSAAGGAGASRSGAVGCAPVTVTVTQALSISTVTVTETAGSIYPTYPAAVVSANSGVNAPAPAPVKVISPASSSASEVVIVKTATMIPIPATYAANSPPASISTAAGVPVPTYAANSPPAPPASTSTAAGVPVPTYVSVPVSAAPYAISNGTVTSTRCSKDLPSGFVTSAKSGATEVPVPTYY